ncbi:TolC family protein [Flavobacterium sp. DG1-102-2]|uniref:TolC family protein n=1 Tax=Flavobacterium sp. DG1-102-2 TaxID=3081663 RepID=UPI0029498FE4|nr:TolC family protein [Flavobacterium sp. DG1-102-2]MDV6170267.1 TolC family protein [Flavobacterium sp. DG1-102-2]
MKNKLCRITILAVLLLGGFANAQVKKWTLEECVDYAIKNNISIKLSALDAQTTLVAKSDAWGALLPTANIQGSHSWNIGLNQNITTGLLENQTTQFTSIGLNMGIDIYNGLQNQNRLIRARLAIVAAQYKQTKMEEDTALNVANAYLQILFNKENLRVQEQQLAYDTKQMERTEQLVEGGAVPRGDLLDIKATIAADNQKKIAAENALLISKLSLAQLMQLDDFLNFDTADSDYPEDKSSVMMEKPATIYDKAKGIRTDLKAAQADVDVAERDVKIARGAYQPRLTGFYSFTTRAAYSDKIIGFQPNTSSPTTVIGYVEGTNQNVLQPNSEPILGKRDPIIDQFNDNKGHSFGVQLSIPILNGFSARNNVERSKIELERSKITLQQKELDLERNVYTAYTDAQGAQKAYDAAVSAANARDESLNYAKERYEVGLINVFDLNQAQTLAVNAQSEVLRTKYDLIFKVKILEFYFGIPIYQKQ